MILVIEVLSPSSSSLLLAILFLTLLFVVQIVVNVLVGILSASVLVFTSFNSILCKEIEINKETEINDNSATSALYTILKDLALGQSIRNFKAKNILTHIDVNAILTFEIIPFLVDVRGLEPFKTSDKLLTYYEKNKSRTLMERWFING